MSKNYPVIACLMLSLFSPWAADTKALPKLNSMASPKLKQFLSNHPDASKYLSETLSNSFSNRVVQLYYFYSDDESVPRAVHYYPDEGGKVGICVRENQLPSDEYICLLFEAINSEGESRFRKLVEQAKAGTVTKSDFVNEILRQEFVAVKKTKDLISRLKLSKKETADSYYSKKFIECPDQFLEYISYLRKYLKPGMHDPFKYYEAEFDSLHNSRITTQQMQKDFEQQQEKFDKDFNKLFPEHK